tara:strand:+ start:345 stop:878 length:534 start_codon:yes stop_codon:yes gene_type:complete
MNIFYLSDDPVQCAKWHCDQHVTKMILEYAQLLSTAHRVLDGKHVKVLSNSGKRMVSNWKLDGDSDKVYYKVAHVSHPSNIWTRESGHHYIWLWRLWHNLCLEYTERYGKTHMTWKKLRSYLSIIPQNIEDAGFKPPPQCMPDELKSDWTHLSYRQFYKTHKREFATWKTETPPWFN